MPGTPEPLPQRSPRHAASSGASARAGAMGGGAEKDAPAGDAETGFLRRAAGRLPHGRRLAIALVVGVAAVLVVATSAVYAIDTSRHDGKVAGGITLDGKALGGLTKAQLMDRLATMDEAFGKTPVEVKVEGSTSSDGDSFTADAASLGLHIDREATAEKVLEAGKTGSLPSQVFGWLQRRVSDQGTNIVTHVDRKAALDAVAARARDGEDPPVEASITVGKTSKVFIGVSGRPGEGIDAEQLIKDLPRAAAKGTNPIKVTARHGEVAPRFSKDDADALAKQAEALVSAPLDLQAGAQTGQLTPAALRAVVTSSPGETGLQLDVDSQALADAAAKVLVKAGTAATEPKFNVNGAGGIDITPGTAGQSCCGPDAPAKLESALRNRVPGPVSLELVEAQPKLSLEAAQALGIKEVVSTFTTKHPAGQPRVQNIHRIADLVRGQVIQPGQTLSINALIGPRTLEKGFVVDHVIEDGKFAESVGGGISQFATTLFNSSWFAGLEFGEYQSHSLYISRYPYGREATLNFPHPDLKVKNPSPYGILVWPTYTGTSLTVTLYSTKWVNVEAVGQDKVPDGSCTKVIAKRKRTFLDGRVAMDSTTARYRANEGQNCGDDEPPEETTTTKVGATTTTKPGGTTTTTKAGSTTTTKKPSATTTTKP